LQERVRRIKKPEALDKIINRIFTAASLKEAGAQLPAPEFIIFCRISFLVGLLTGMTVAYVGVVLFNR